MTLVFLRNGDELGNTVIELTCHWGVDRDDIELGDGPLVFAANDVYRVADDIKRKGGKIIREVDPMNTSNTMNFVRRRS